MSACIILPVWMTMRTVHASPPWAPAAPNPTPFGYSVSLVLFLVPVIVIGIWHQLRPLDSAHRRAFWWSAALVGAAGFVLDIGFGYEFFQFRNPDATLGIRVAAWSFSDRGWIVHYLPIEEFGFYVLGGLFVVSLYSWADGNWLNTFSPSQRSEVARWQERIVNFSPSAAVLAVVLVALGFWVKSHDTAHPGIPGYYLFLVTVAFVPGLLVLRGVELFINWRAFGFAYSALLLISLLWEVTLALPYQWWDYKPEHMLGIRILAWSNLPLEAVMVWLMVTWDTIIAFEVIRVGLYMGRSTRHALFGTSARQSTAVVR
jgi:hypothetical protein